MRPILLLAESSVVELESVEFLSLMAWSVNVSGQAVKAHGVSSFPVISKVCRLDYSLLRAHQTLQKNRTEKPDQ